MKSSEDSQSPSSRRAYQPPKLVVYGEIRTLTANGTQSTGEDGGMMSTNMG